VREVTLHRSGRCVDGVRVRAHGRTLGCRVVGEHGAGSHPRMRIELQEPAERTAPGQIACLYAGDVVVGHGTIAG
jgi:tRNA U34 2-thiouridine synthase MnmA/TrmU